MNPSTTIEKLFEVYSKRLVRYADSLLGKGGALEGSDAVMNVFVKLQNVDLSLIKNEPAYLYNLVKNECLNIIKSETRRSRRDKERRGVVSEEYSDSIVVKSELVGSLTIVYESLSPARKRIFEMIYFEKKTLNEIAAELRLSVNTIYVQKQRIDRAFGIKNNQRWFAQRQTRDGYICTQWIKCKTTK